MINDQILEELLQPVMVKVNGRTKRGPTKIQAYFRKMLHEGLSAPASAAAQKMLFDVVDRVTTHDAQREQEWADFLARSKPALEAKLSHERRHGAVPIDLAPHPRDIVIDPWSGEHRIDGPVNADQKRLENSFISHRREAEFMMQCSATAYHEATSEQERGLHLQAVATARSVWLHYNAKVGLNERLSPAMISRFEPENIMASKAYFSEGAPLEYGPLPEGWEDDF
ncbi:hypothetical protein EIK56_14360 [Sphingomonas sp. C8-2]|nr:hypothetical protein EIK56_14360 [Sphingomonas sp. C8-2]